MQYQKRLLRTGMNVEGMSLLHLGEDDEDDIPTGKYSTADVEQAIESSRRSSPPELPATGT